MLSARCVRSPSEVTVPTSGCRSASARRVLTRAARSANESGAAAGRATCAWMDLTAGWRNVTSGSPAKASACARSMRARIVRYCHDGATISPPSASICTVTVSTTAIERTETSTATGPFGSVPTWAGARLTPAAIGSPRDSRSAWRSCESIFCWAGVRALFSRRSAWICCTVWSETPSAAYAAGKTRRAATVADRRVVRNRARTDDDFEFHDSSGAARAATPDRRRLKTSAATSANSRYVHDEIPGARRQVLDLERPGPVDGGRVRLHA